MSAPALTTDAIKIEDFRRWLESKPRECRPFHRQDCCRCPLAIWLRERCPDAAVGSMTVISDRYCVEVLLPEWCQLFVETFDTAIGRGRGPASASVALEALSFTELSLRRRNAR